MTSSLKLFSVYFNYFLYKVNRFQVAVRLFSVYFNSFLYKVNRFQVAVRLFSKRSQRTSKCGKNIKVAHEAQPSVSRMF